MRARLAALTLPLFLSLSALGVDGVLEINQSCAVNTGCFVGDAAGFPVTIANAGSYVLTGNLTVSSTSSDGIELTADGVQIDLNGFEIAGPVTCNGGGSGMNCSGGTGHGIAAGSSSRVSVRNGRVRGFETGISILNRARVHDVIVDSNRLQGIFATIDAMVTSSIAYRNGFFGIVLGPAANVDGSSAHANRHTGIVAGNGSTIVDSIGYANGNHGIQCNDGCVIRNSSVYQNEMTGIICGEGCTVSDASAHDNSHDGIQVGDGAMVQRSTMRANGVYGLRFSAATQATYRENTISGNGTDTVFGSGVNMYSNSCNGTTSCP